jgi:hypothetical protein
VQGSCKYGNEPGKFLNSYATCGFSRRTQLHEVSYSFSEIIPYIYSISVTVMANL